MSFECGVHDISCRMGSEPTDNSCRNKKCSVKVHNLCIQASLGACYDKEKFYCWVVCSLIGKAAFDSRDMPRPTSFVSESTGYHRRNPKAAVVHSGNLLKLDSRSGVQLEAPVKLPRFEPSPIKNDFASGNTGSRSRRRAEHIRSVSAEQTSEDASLRLEVN